MRAAARALTLGRVAYTQQDLDAVRRAIARGEKSVMFADRSVTYRSMDELIEAERRILAALQPSRPRQYLGVTCKGF